LFEENGAVTSFAATTQDFLTGIPVAGAHARFVGSSGLHSDESEKVRGRHEVQDDRF
jgi:hypothetical protein